VLVFLQNWRAMLIPLVAVPVAIVGTFSIMAALGFSLNNISLFGLVLAIGIVVDDAIVVVENVERWLEQGLPPREAARKAMDQVTGPVIAVALVLCAVFVPCAFISGITGQFFRQFAVTIAVSTVFSTINSLSLSPALAAIFLQSRGAHADRLKWLLEGAWLVLPAFQSAVRDGDRSMPWAVASCSEVVFGAWCTSVCSLDLLTFARVRLVSSPIGSGRLIVNVHARLSVAPADRCRAGPDRKICPGDARRCTCYLDIRQLVRAIGQQLHFGSMFIILDPFGASEPRPGHGHHGQAQSPRNR
jgi:multidrug efflux pump